MHSQDRPKFLSLLVLGPKMSVTAKVSILHRLAGLILFLAIPFILYIFHQSLISHDFYTTFYGVMTSPIAKVIYLVLIWGFCHHLCAGVRFLFLDLDVGVNIKTAQFTAKLVLVISIIMTVVLGVLIW